MSNEELRAACDVGRKQGKREAADLVKVLREALAKIALGLIRQQEMVEIAKQALSEVSAEQEPKT